MKKIISTALALAACLLLAVPAMAAEVGSYGFVWDPWTGSYNPWNGSYSYWNGDYSYWNGDYTYWNGPSYVAGPSRSGYVSGTWSNQQRGFNHFQRTRAYAAGTYQDVPAGAWYETGVKTLYEMGILAEGSRFRPDGGLTLGEAVSLAVRIHSTYNGWTVPAGMTELQYALNMGIVEYGQYDNYADPASRRSFAAIMARALPSEALRGINVIMDGAIPDVPASDPGAWGIYTLYRAGVLVGSDAWGTFYPNERISRASAAVIMARMVDSSQRKGVSLLTQEASGISLDRNTLVLYPGQSRTLTAYVYPVNAVNRSVSWASSDNSVATVDAYGTVNALRPGSAVITAVTAAGAMASCMVQVSSGF